MNKPGSILARRSRRAHLDVSGVAVVALYAFQSSPGAPAGRTMPLSRDSTPLPGRFNPRPALPPGAHSHRCEKRGDRARFNPRPALPPGAPCGAPCPADRPALRFNPRPALPPGAPGTQPPFSHLLRAFQSSPGAPAGRTSSPWSVPPSPNRFNPRPALPGLLAVHVPPVPVSILARRSRRAHPCPRLWIVGDVHVSILARRSRRAHTARPVGATPRSSRFNPRPALPPGARGSGPSPARASGSFNPRPALPPGAQEEGGVMICGSTPFQSSPGAPAGRTIRLLLRGPLLRVVSILARRSRRAHTTSFR